MMSKAYKIDAKVQFRSPPTRIEEKFHLAESAMPRHLNHPCPTNSAFFNIFNITMANQSAEFYCSSVEASDGGVYFVGAEVTPCPEEPSAINEATVNITVTDGRRAWTAEG